MTITTTNHSRTRNRSGGFISPLSFLTHLFFSFAAQRRHSAEAQPPRDRLRWIVGQCSASALLSHCLLVPEIFEEKPRIYTDATDSQGLSVPYDAEKSE